MSLLCIFKINMVLFVIGMQRLQCLDLSGNECHSAGMSPLRAAIECLFPCMEKGYVEVMLSAVMEPSLMSLSTRRDGLKELYLSDNPLGPLGASYVVNFIQKSETLLKLEIANVDMASSGVPILLSTLRNNDGLMTLDISRNKITAFEEDVIMVWLHVLV
jgi:hypothetical protein